MVEKCEKYFEIFKTFLTLFFKFKLNKLGKGFFNILNWISIQNLILSMILKSYQK